MFFWCVCGGVCRWAHQLGGSKHLIPLVSCAMNFTGTLRPAAQVRHPVAVHRYNILALIENKLKVFGWTWRECRCVYFSLWKWLKFMWPIVVQTRSSLHFVLTYCLTQTEAQCLDSSRDQPDRMKILWIFLIRMAFQIKDLARDSWFKLSVICDRREAWTVLNIPWIPFGLLRQLILRNDFH